MTLRTRVLLLGVGLILAANLGLGAVMLVVQRSQLLREIDLRARTFVEVVGTSTLPYLADNRLDDLDRIVSDLLEQHLEDLDIRFLAIADPDMRVLAHTRQALYGTTLADEASRLACLREQPMVWRVNDEAGEALMVSLPLVTAVGDQPGIRWGTVLAGFGLDRLAASLVRTLVGTLAAILLVTLVAAALTTAVLDGQIVRPLRRLTTAADELAQGDLTVRADLQGRDEIAALGTTFNSMAEALERNTRELEAQVRARTRELTDANRLLSEANERLQRLATTDGLTGLYNFRHFDQTLRAELRRSARQNLPLSLLMMDVDHFKHYNDHQGHPAGDGALRAIADIIRQRLRVTDIPCRYGGEEFAAILLDTSLEAAMEVAEELRAKVEEQDFPGEDVQPDGRLTISIGVATWPRDGTSAEALLRAADGALYGAKQDGRNRIQARATPQGSPGGTA